ncbi:MAG TPA: 2-C-methyl-D-erythritol 4-phosphate cytidylyltransferase [bacterium]|nr:2-C-methyl-D-erythritol 4-phosphate cytidylyltransferase [bacterium]HPO10495.1 2-C-methyl-D-erythritol 4-phosphate cytidylyltransferase [bacterium]HQO36846.1 2-C-methyl-D-erythritol 4-phosphate cytidylyltransferase [bacterium]HQQ00894.1 2-C-methyl-D-erythritol 4-phosphate cytidylyltransferase [bacterium]
MSIAAIVVAAGQGKRMGAEINKVLLPLAGKPVLAYCLETLNRSERVDRIVVVTRREDAQIVETLIGQYGIAKAGGEVVPGGAERFDSVLAGLNVLADNPPDSVLIQDAARPFLTEPMIRDTLNALAESPGAVAGVPCKDTVKQVDDTRAVIATPDRSSLWIIQTPQTFRFGAILNAYRGYRPPPYPTDDAALLEYRGERVTMIMASYANMKITTPEDLPIAEAMLCRRTE